MSTIYTVWYDLKYADQGAYLEVLRLLPVSYDQPVTQPRMTYRRTENHMNLDQYKGIKYIFKC